MKIIKSKYGIFKEYCNIYLPLYIRLPFTLYWLAIWSSPMLNKGQTHWQALRITLRYGKYHSLIIYIVKKGII